MDATLLQRGFTPQPLSPTQYRELDENGFTLLENVIDPAWLDRLRQAFEELVEQEGDEAGVESGQMKGVRRLSDLANKGEVFDAIYLQPALLTAVLHIFQRPFKVSSLNGHDPMANDGLQALHGDGPPPATPEGPFRVVNSMWMLDDFTKDNGATRIIPGTHRKLGKIDDYIEDGMVDHPEQIHLQGPAGSVAVFNGSIWHGSYINRSGRPRRTLHCAFIARELNQQNNQREYLRPETAERLSPLARYILDVD
jgi:ectoine hydroxylase-related dioxygenase (phytanoyl-CoA dioxygenase family)